MAVAEDEPPIFNSSKKLALDNALTRMTVQQRREMAGMIPSFSALATLAGAELAEAGFLASC